MADSACRFTLLTFLAATLVMFISDLSAQEVQTSGRLIQVAVYEGKGVSRSLTHLLQDLEQDDGIRVGRISTDQILRDELNEYDVVVFPGGSGSGQARSLGSDGREKVRHYVESGGGYVGICAGAYLASADYDWSLQILDARVLDRQHWARGFGNVRLSVEPLASEQLSLRPDQLTYYHQGPLLAPAGYSEIDDYQQWATFATEVTKEGVPSGVMPGTTAIAAGKFGTGRVLAISPHLERTTGLDHAIPAAIHWAAGPDRTLDLVMVQKGDLPIIISAPHGGNLKLAGVEPRTGNGLECGPAGFRVVRDGGTEELALETARQLAIRMNGKPSFVISRVHRRYVDFNRPPNIGVESPDARILYDQYHAALDDAVRTVRSTFPSGLLIDIHGQGTSAEIAYRGTANGLTISAVKSKFGESLIHGPDSLAGLLQQRGWKVHPDPLDGKEQPGFAGGYIVKTYGSHRPQGIDAIQWELGVDYRKSVVRKDVAKKLADSIAEYFDKIRELESRDR